MPDERAFDADLDQLTRAATVHLPALADLMSRQVGALSAFDGVAPSTMAPNVESTLYEFNALLRDRATTATQVVEETAAALTDVAALYRRADGRA
ncbi:hypothetical protein [Actinokineospora sp. NBRC 105648]|uniref:hypothetical protein n=1 Tax=Actinokineospora sp. NBRC 105648 TaxID=3032206 RepID=UPI0024A14483|nr:hypothetical protein [Actinokineospora sp. NBRC 105648]GLZ43377.1 hypothetical protein Acsp05_70010 [Actinokineospora sp. NBRC 105648]